MIYSAMQAAPLGFRLHQGFMIFVILANIKKTATQVNPFFSHKNKVYSQRKINKE